MPVLNVKKVRTFYNDLAAEYWSRVPYFYGREPLTIFYDIRERCVVRNLINVESSSLVLDIGSGPGRWVIEYGERDANVVAIDISAEMIRANKRKVAEICRDVEVMHVVGDAEHLPFQYNKFDIVNCIDAFPHFPNPIQSLYEMKRIAKPSGVIIFEPSNKFSPVGVVIQLIRFLNKTFGIWKSSLRGATWWNRYDSVREIKRWTELTRLKLEKVIGVGIFPTFSHKLTRFLLKLEMILENTSLLNMLGSRVVFIVRKESYFDH